ncbi:hypothetical protein CQW23_04444 [Capsicum baccatum]|uniref:Uncharacterized protein n=1 Tax=Capsicum baccatum TaxID=33114 RepID=A0A2G2XEN8_CAPBA|nr:hypothetical protein CQW23_04444 [Capsicum baccatum]
MCGLSSHLLLYGMIWSGTAPEFHQPPLVLLYQTLSLFGYLLVIGFRKLLSWAWLTCIVFIPEMIVKSTTNTLKVKSSVGKFLYHELSAVDGAITVTCLMVSCGFSRGARELTRTP